MPGKTGPELVDDLKNTNKEMKILYSSGYSSKELIRYGVNKKGMNFLPKPYEPQELARKLRQVLDK